MKLPHYFALGAAGCALLVSATAFCAEAGERDARGGPPQSEHRPPPPPGFGPGPGNLRGIALTDAQQRKMFVIIDSHEAQRAVHVATLDETDDALRILAMSGKFDEARAAALAQAAGKATAALMLLDARADAHIQALLTPEQRDKARSAGRRPMSSH